MTQEKLDLLKYSMEHSYDEFRKADKACFGESKFNGLFACFDYAHSFNWLFKWATYVKLEKKYKKALAAASKERK